MKIIIKKIAVIGLILFLLMQLYQPARNIALEQDITANFTKVYNVPKNVATILKTSCYDCHSNNTNYPYPSYKFDSINLHNINLGNIYNYF